MMMGHVLVVDDDLPLLSLYERILGAAGYSVDRATDGQVAADMVRAHDYDVVVSDISMPNVDGIQLLRMLREREDDVPLVLVTGGPEVETAVKAIELGAVRYLIKPVDPGALRKVVAAAVEAYQNKRHRHTLLGAQFEKALETLWMAYQPIVASRDNSIYGYEALVRTAEPEFPHPGALFDAAERLDRVRDVGRVIRAQVATVVPSAPADSTLLVNLHPLDLLDDELYSPLSPLSLVASRVVLEITERASLDKVADVTRRVTDLKGLGFRIAIDDLGAGYAGLSSLAILEPDVVKIDMSLVRGINTDVVRQKMVRSLTMLCHEMNRLVVAEGIETAEERDTVRAIGCELLQGYLWARPGRAFPGITL